MKYYTLIMKETSIFKSHKIFENDEFYLLIQYLYK